MNEVALEGLSFKAYHGYYDEEQERGNNFEVDISVRSSVEGAAETDDLTMAVNYEDIYKIVKEEMQISSRLLENVVSRIIDRVLQELSAVESVTVSLKKFAPPFGGECRAARVTMSRER